MIERNISPSLEVYKKVNSTILKRTTCRSHHISGLVCIPLLFPPLLLHPTYFPTGQPAGFVTFLITSFTVYLGPHTTLSAAFTPVGLVCIPTSSQSSSVTTSCLVPISLSPFHHLFSFTSSLHPCLCSASENPLYLCFSCCLCLVLPFCPNFFTG